MNHARLGTEIKKWRKLRKMTQKELAVGICNQSEISRLEKGDSYPSIDTLHAISQKLRLPLSYFLEVLIHDDVEKTERIREEVQLFSSKKDFEGLNKYLEAKLGNKEILHPELRHYLLFHQLVSLYYLKKIDYKYCVTELRNLINHQVGGLDVLLNLRIKNTIASILAENNFFEESTLIFKEILEENNASDEYELLRIKFLYNVGKLQFLQQQYNDAKATTEEAIELSLKHHDMLVLGQLYYQKGSILEKLGSPAGEIAAEYQRALFFFDLLGLDYYKKILQEYKQEFLVSQ
ncbi:helix-turn-helix domain-containing protein [Bhargavaea ullalensis]|uniref:Transcriptional regulator with XRE-family HTH domain n=1 Tax=Bhargavaea ullalensis TaxID=1265685 RepID=A0ABV2G7E2_9BACL